jgi:hypothetical protein
VLLVVEQAQLRVLLVETEDLEELDLVVLVEVEETLEELVVMVDLDW